MIKSYKNRRLDATKPIKIFRNLTKKGIWYSIQQAGLTVAHSTDITICEAKFYVNEKARLRVVKNKRKEFHAYIEGMVINKVISGLQVKYNPYLHNSFIKRSVKPTHRFYVGGM
jgi:hypothetical protein